MRQVAAALLGSAMLLGVTGTGLLHPARAETKEVRLSAETLFDLRSAVPSNVLLNLSTDRSTVGAAYRLGSAAAYNKTVDYPGYFNPLKCYTYAAAPKAYFEISSGVTAANTHECNGSSFSGNFLNWASMSTLDLLRYGLTGGDRITPESATPTIVQRAVLPADFINNASLFPARVISSTDGGNVSAPVKVTPFNLSGIQLVSCENKLIIAEKTIPVTGCAAPTRNAKGSTVSSSQVGEYLVRVKVCDAEDGPARPDLCMKFGANYKPVGILQRNADKARFGLMSYLPENEWNRYGALLRSPLKFLGPKKFESPGYKEASNDRAEWDGATGILYANPDDPSARDSSTVKSGLINYINQFGRNGAYKSYAPVSEMYYESLRYLQGLQPTAAATTGITDAMKDGFPILGSWTDPIGTACQWNQVALIANANSNYDFFIPGNTRTDMLDTSRAKEAAVTNKTPELDAVFWTRKLGEMEADASGKAGNPAKNSRLANLDTQLTGYLNYGSYYVSGLAYWANTNDIRLDKPVRAKTFVVDFDDGGNGDIDNATRSPSRPRESQLYLAAKYGGFDDVSGEASPNPFVALGNDGVSRVNGSTLAWDANRDGVPDNFFLASQPGTLLTALRKLGKRVSSFSSTTLSASAIASNRLIPGDTFLYQAGLRAPQWTGSLKKLRISAEDPSNVDSALQISATAEWDAGDLLTGAAGRAASPLPSARNIYTAILKADRTLATIPFSWNSLASDQQALLNKSPVDGSVDALGSRRLDYLRGVRSDELGQTNGFMRSRTSVLGDIVNSNVVFVGAPSVQIQSASYKTFYDTYKNRASTVYVGANDGMLHAFNANTGAEQFAYIPRLLLPKLTQLTRPDYEHQSYVDGQITVAEARVGSNWKTVLASGFGNGAQGVFALDVTNPDNFARGGGVLFEFSDSDDGDMGNLMGAPVIAKFRTAVVNNVPQYKYFVVVPCGLNNYKVDEVASKYNAAAPGAIFLLSLDKAANEAWSLGVNYYKILLPNLKPEMQSGVAPPALAVGADGAVRYAYAGDLQGNLWRLDFTGLPPWSTALGTAARTPLFTPAEASADRSQRSQPITMQPKLVFAPGGGYVVLFGTGKFYEPADLASGNFGRQSFYAIYDSTRDADKGISRADLMQRDIASDASGTGYKVTGNDFMYVAAPGMETLVKKGWYVDFPKADKTGERAVTNPLVIDGQLYFNTLAPGNDPCGTGTGRAYSLDALTGLSGKAATGIAASVGMLGTPVVFQMGATSTGNRDGVGRRSGIKNLRVLHVGTGNPTDPSKSNVAAAGGNAQKVTIPAGRFSWREIINWQEIRAAATRPGS